MQSVTWTQTVTTKTSESLCRGIYEFKKGTQPRVHLIKGKNGNLLVDFPNTVDSWKNCFS